jgi:hypothetical protein
MNCGRCHSCGNKLRQVLDGEEWCDNCGTYLRYHAHGCSYDEDDKSKCQEEAVRMTGTDMMPWADE